MKIFSVLLHLETFKKLFVVFDALPLFQFKEKTFYNGHFLLRMHL